jgi:hypothetical protein
MKQLKSGLERFFAIGDYKGRTMLFQVFLVPVKIKKKFCNPFLSCSP